MPIAISLMPFNMLLYMNIRPITPIIAAIFLLTSLGLMAQAPEWANADYRKLHYPERDYLVGFASEKNVNKEVPQELLNRIASYAKGQLVEYVQVSVSSVMTQSTEEAASGEVKKTFSSMYSASSNLEIVGLKVETAYDAKEKTGYAVAYATKKELYGYYKGLVQNGLVVAEQKVAQANKAIEAKNNQLALSASLEATSELLAIEQAQRIMLAIKPAQSQEEDIQVERTAKLRGLAEDIMRKAQHSDSNTLDDAASFLVRGLKQQAHAINKPLVVANFTYQDTKMASELSRRLNQILATKLISGGGFHVATEGAQAGDHYVVTGTFWKSQNDIKLIASLKDLTGKVVATSEGYISLDKLAEDGISYLPENFEEAYSKMRAFGKNEIVKGDLNVEIWTNKGDDNLVYTKGEILKFFIRANKECYLRFVYHLADGQSVLLLDNYYVAQNMVNRVIELPDEFECSEPFGVETLQVNAQTEQFPPLFVVLQDGYSFIKDNLDAVLVGSRGFKRVSAASGIPEKAEKRLIFTTMAK